MVENIYEKYSVKKLIFIFSIPAILSLIIEIMSSIVDTSFAGYLGDGGLSLSIMGILAPILTLFTAIQALYAVSTSILISKSMGEENGDAITKVFKVGLVMTIIVGGLTSMIFFIFQDNILKVLGVNNDIYYLAKQYYNIALISNIFSSIGYTLSSCIRAAGRPKTEVTIISLAVIFNIIFNIIFTLGFGLGLKGLALGTLLSEIINMVLCLVVLIRMNFLFKPVCISLVEYKKISINMFKIGVAQVLIQMVGSVTGLAINNRILAYGTLTYTAVWNIVQNLYMLMLMPIIGLTQGIQSVLAYYIGKGNNKYTNEVVKSSIFYCFLYGVLIMVLIFMFGENILYIFTENKEIIEKSIGVSKTVFITFPVIGIVYTYSSFLQTKEKELESVIIILVRQLIVVVWLIIILPIIFIITNNTNINMGSYIFIAIPIADILALLLIKVKYSI
ncbi:MAG: MATE family efflux transporter [Clostridium sp.]